MNKTLKSPWPKEPSDPNLTGGYDLGETDHRPDETFGQEMLWEEIMFRAAQPFSVAGIDGRLIKANPAYCELIGYQEEELYQINWIDDLTPAKWQAREHQILRQLHETGKPQRYEKEYTRQDGRIVPVEVVVQEVCDYRGKSLYYYGFITDISERVRIREKVRQSETHNRELYEGSRDGYALVDMAGKFVESNTAFKHMLGFNAAELKKRTYEDITPVKWRAGELALLREQVLNGRGYSDLYEKEYIRSDGTLIPVEIRTYLRRDGQGKPMGMWAYVRDVSHQKQAEARLRQSEQQLRDLIDSMSDLVYTQDLEGRFLSVNPAMTHNFGFSQKEMIGHRSIDFKSDEADEERNRQYLEIVKREGAYDGIAKFSSKKSGPVYIEFRSTLVKPEGGEPYISGIGRDATQRIEAERKIKRLQKQVVQTQKMEAIGTLAGGIAHDFNNLMMGIQGNTTMVLMDTPKSHPHFSHLKNIEDYVRSATALTKQLLGFARRGKYEVKPANINTLIRKTLCMFGRTKKELTIRTQLRRDLPAVEIDHGQMEQVILNLLVNAAHSMPGGGRLWVETEEERLDNTYTQPYRVASGRYLKIAVTDNGVGMDKATCRRVFEPFFTTKAMGRGTGLGLASAYGIVKHHGGIINVYSEKGEGSTFTIHLPASSKAVAVEYKPDLKIATGTETILLVDDEQMIIDIATQMMEHSGYKVVTAQSGRDALAVIENAFANPAIHTRPDLVILDMILPGMSGGETFDRIKARDPEMKILLSSGYSLNGQASEILSRGCDGFIQKPYNLEALTLKLREILDR